MSGPDACPGILRLHEAADGHLARVRLPGGRIGARGLRAVADASALGNGIVELTSRAGLQVRGLGPDRAEFAAGILASGGLLPSPGHDRVRNIAAPPLAGRAEGAVADIDAVVDRLDRALCADADLAALPGRFLFAVDDGTRALEPLVADVELAAERDGFRLVLGGTATRLVVAAPEAADAAIAAARAFLGLAPTPGAWRVTDLPGGASALAHRLGAGVRESPAQRARRDPPAQPPRRHPPAPVGVIPQRDGRAAVAALPPLARLDPVQLRALAALAGPRAAVRISPWRTVTFVDLPAPEAEALAGELVALGLVVSASSGWAGLSACAGLGACARARVDVRTAAAVRAGRRDGRSPREHWSGCERRCGEPADAVVTAVATSAGVLVCDGVQAPGTVPSIAVALTVLSGPRVLA